MARRSEKVEELSKKLSGKTGRLFAVRGDITKEEDILNVFKWIKLNLGPLHILINNAGILRKTSLIDGETKLWREIVETNLMGLCICTREAVRVMRNTNTDGHIIHINSVAGHMIPVFPDMNIYPATKHGVTALTKVLRNELVAIQSRIKITSVSPGYVATEILEASAKGSGLKEFPEVFKEVQAELSALEPEDIADAVIYALSTPPHVQVHEMIVKPVGELF